MQCVPQFLLQIFANDVFAFFFQCATSGFTNMDKSSDGDVAKLLKKSNAFFGSAT